MQAEDLNITLPITLWRMETSAPSRDTELAKYLEKADDSGSLPAGKDRFFTVINEELETASSALLISRLRRHALPLEYPMAQLAKTAREHGALVDSEKATSLEFPVIVATGQCNFVGLANNHFWRSGCYLDPWGSWPDLLPQHFPNDCSGFATAGFDLYYALLNMGFHLEPSAGSSFGVHPVPLGWSRVYVHVKGKFDPESWFLALEEGHSFVTTGPMILLKVNGLEPGEEYHGRNFPLSVTISLEILAPDPSQQAEIIVNGAVYPITLLPESGRRYAYQGKMSLSLEGSSWIAARWLEKEGDTASVAHTAPVYFWDRDLPIPIPQSDAQYFLKRVERLKGEVESGNSEIGVGPTTILTPTGNLRNQTLDFLNQALGVFRAKVQQSR
jgi:hypothetical protein